MKYKNMRYKRYARIRNTIKRQRKNKVKSELDLFISKPEETITITKEEYEKLLEYKAMYIGLY